MGGKGAREQDAWVWTSFLAWLWPSEWGSSNGSWSIVHIVIRVGGGVKWVKILKHLQHKRKAFSLCNCDICRFVKFFISGPIHLFGHHGWKQSVQQLRRIVIWWFLNNKVWNWREKDKAAGGTTTRYQNQVFYFIFSHPFPLVHCESLYLRQRTDEYEQNGCFERKKGCLSKLMKDWQDYLSSFKWLNAFRGFRKSLWFMLFQKLTARSFFAVLFFRSFLIREICDCDLFFLVMGGRGVVFVHCFR